MKIDKLITLVFTVLILIGVMNCAFNVPFDIECESTVTYESCSICAKTDPNNKNIKITKSVSTPTCTQGGSEITYYSYLCGHGVDYDSGLKTYAIDPDNHDYSVFKEVEGTRVDATCDSGGHYTEAIFCSRCGKEKPNSRSDETLYPAHKEAPGVKEDVVDSTCTKKGSYNLVVYCSVCEEKISSTPMTIEMKEHTPASAVKENIHDSTCAATGTYDSVVYCSASDCKKELSRTPTTIEKKPHTPLAAVEENRVEATCIKDGSYDSVIYCEKCHAEVSRENKVITTLGHTPLAAVEENRVEAKCNEEGHYDSVVYCKVCKDELSRKNVVIPKIPHGASELINQVGATMESEGYTGDSICSVCKEVLTKGSVVPKLTQDSVNEDNVDKLFDDDVKLSDETKEALKELTEDNKETVLEIIDSTNKTMSTLDSALKKGTITKEEYQEYVEKVEIIVETVIKAENQKTEVENKAEELGEIVPPNLGIDLKEEVKEFYEKQIALLLNIGGDTFDMEISLETYKQALTFIADSVEKMEEAALMIKECSGESFVEQIELYIKTVSAKTFKDFDQAKADEEFVEAAYQAILLNMQAQVIDSLNENYQAAKASGQYVGASLQELEDNYQEEMANVSDLESFEIMVTEIMRLKYVSKLGEKLTKGEIGEVDYLNLITSSSDVDVFMPIYKEIFKSWALNTDNEYGMSLEELSTAALDFTKKNMIPDEYSGKITDQDKAAIAYVLGFGGINASAYALFNALKKRRLGIKV